jgi:hypothetical protein
VQPCPVELLADPVWNVAHELDEQLVDQGGVEDGRGRPDDGLDGDRPNAAEEVSGLMAVVPDRPFGFKVLGPGMAERLKDHVTDAEGNSVPIELL